MATASEDCNGLSMMENGTAVVTYVTDVCQQRFEDGISYSYKYTCNDEDEGVYSYWDGPFCQGNGTSGPVEDFYPEDEGYSMMCGGVDCPYAMMQGWESMEDDNDTFVSTTSSPMNFTYSTEEPDDCDDSANVTGLDAYEWAVAMSVQCDEMEYNGTTYYVNWECEDDELYVAYYTNSVCWGSPIGAEPHPAMDQLICPTVNCSRAESLTAEPTYEPTSPTTQPSVYPSWDPTGAPTVDPTASPSMDTTAEPTVDPTSGPTPAPSKSPTVNPSMEPTEMRFTTMFDTTEMDTTVDDPSGAVSKDYLMALGVALTFMFVRN